jgi:hypothetical protein
MRVILDTSSASPMTSAASSDAKFARHSVTSTQRHQYALVREPIEVTLPCAAGAAVPYMAAAAWKAGEA